MKYNPLATFLKAAKGGEVPMTFAEIEAVIGAPLPPAARKHRAWWSNNGSNNVMVKAWKAAGFRSERVDMAGERLVFARTPGAPVQLSDPKPISSSVQEVSMPFVLDSPPLPAGGLHGLLRGSVLIPPGLDLTAPTGEAWDAEG